MPDEYGVKGVKKMLDLTKNLKKEDTVICLISGGGSALLPYVTDEVSLDEVKELTDISNALKKGSKLHAKQSEQLMGASKSHIKQSEQLDKIAVRIDQLPFPKNIFQEFESVLFFYIFSEN